MKYKHQFKNKAFANALGIIFGEDCVDNELQKQINDESDYIYIEIFEPEGIKASITIPKEETERVPDYDPDNWNPYPQLTPPRSGLYFIYRTYEFENKITVDRYEEGKYGGRWSETAVKSILAFKECHLGKPEFLP